MSSIFKFSPLTPVLPYFMVKIGHFWGTPKMAYFGRNLCITSSKMVKTIRIRCQNDGQSTPDNFFEAFGGWESTFDRNIAKLLFFRCTPLMAPYGGYTEKTIISRYFGQKWILTPQVLQKSCQAYFGVILTPISNCFDHF